MSLCEGDIILLATDGLFDNLHEKQIIELRSPLVGASCSSSCSQTTLQRELQRVADALVRRALELSEDPAYVSPFALEARERGLDALGGALSLLFAFCLSVHCSLGLWLGSPSRRARLDSHRSRSFAQLLFSQHRSLSPLFDQRPATCAVT